MPCIFYFGTILAKAHAIQRLIRKKIFRVFREFKGKFSFLYNMLCELLKSFLFLFYAYISKMMKQLKHTVPKNTIDFKREVIQEHFDKQLTILVLITCLSGIHSFSNSSNSHFSSISIQQQFWQYDVPEEKGTHTIWHKLLENEIKYTQKKKQWKKKIA